MNIFKRMYAKIFQKCMYIGCYFLNFKEPIILKTHKELIEVLKKLNKKNVLILSNHILEKTAPFQNLYESLLQSFTLNTYFEIGADPTLDEIETLVEYAKDKQIDVVISVGGGSVMDAGKVLSARLTNPKKSIKQMKGLLKIKKTPLTQIAIPTTAGTGSECTVAAVVTDKTNQEKYAINDPKLIPNYVFFDPTFLYTLPNHLTSTIGMDALTHALEAYIGSSNTLKTKKAAIKATTLIKENLIESYLNPTNYQARFNMQQAAYYAGIAFTRAYVGNVHAISHALSALYHLPHGYLNAIILPVVLENYGHHIYKKLGKLGKIVFNLDKKNSNMDAAKLFIQYIKDLLKELNIKNNLNEYIKESDYEKLITHINNEVYPLYPVPKYFSDEELINIFNKLKNNA